MLKQSSPRPFDFWKAFPVMDVIDDVVISKRGDLTIGWEITLPEAFTLVQSDYDDFIGIFSSALKVLPGWTVVHRQDIFTYETYSADPSARSFLGRSYECHFEGRRHLVHRSRIFLTMTSKFSPVRARVDSGLLGIKALAQMPDGKELQKFRSKASEFMSILTAKGRIHARQFTTGEYLEDGSSPGLLHSYLSLFGGDLTLSDVVASEDGIRIGDRLASAYVVCESDILPGELDTTGKVESLSTTTSEVHLSFGSAAGILLDCDHAVNQYFLVIPQTDLLRDLDSKRKRMDSMPGSAENKVNSAEIVSFIDETHRNGLTPVCTHLNILAWGPAGDHLDTKGKVSSTLSSMGITGAHDLTDTQVLWYAGIPGGEAELDKDNYMVMEMGSALCLGVYESFGRGLGKGLLKLCDRLSYVPLRLDVQKAAQGAGLISNYNAFILGGSGSGKSFFTNYFLRSCYDAGEAVFVIDVGDSYEGLCSVIREESGGRDGLYYTWDENDPLSFSAFSGLERWLAPDGSLRKDEGGVSFLLSFIRTLWRPAGGWNESNGNVVCQIISDFALQWKDAGREPLFDDFYAFLCGDVTERMSKSKDEKGVFLLGRTPVTSESFDIDGLSQSLADYRAGGSFGFLLNNPHPKDLFRSRFTVFEVDKLKGSGTFYSICVLCIMNAFDARMHSGTDFKVLAIDEAWMAIANETMAPYLAGLWKTSRKYSTSAVVITQQLSDIMNSPVIRDTILQNSSVKILLSQDGGMNFDSVAQMLGLDERYRGLILSMNRAVRPGARYKEVFIKLGNASAGVYSTEVSPEEAVAYESEKPKKAPFLALSEELGSPIKAVQASLQGKSKQ